VELIVKQVLRRQSRLALTTGSTRFGHHATKVEGTGRCTGGLSLQKDSVVHQTPEQTHLEQANGHIEAALARLDWLEGVLGDWRRNGLDANLAESLMHNMKSSLCIMIQYRLSIRRRMAQAGLLAPVLSSRRPALEFAVVAGPP